MEETIRKNAAQSASAQKPQSQAQSRAEAIIRRDVPDFLRELVFGLLASGAARPQDFTESAQKPNAPKYRPQRGRGRHRKGIRPFPMAFPAGTGITWENLYDEQTEKILNGVKRYLAESGLFGADLEDKVQEIREELPFRLQSFTPVPGKPESRYKFTSTAVYNMAKSQISRRQREIELGMPTISLEEKLDADGELTIEDTLAADDAASRREDALDTLRLVFPALEERDQAIVFLHGYLELSIAQIAERLGMSANGVHHRLTVVIPRTAREAVKCDLKGGAR